jgi:ligand-binding SRPBCC domain-containing protein
MRRHSLASTFDIDCPLAEVFEFFSDAGNLARITPASMGFEIQTPGPIVMREGTELEYRVRVRGVRIGWKSLITVWEPPHRFVDEQVRGPYKLWVHEHRFLELGPWKTRVEDEVRYAVPGGVLEPLVHRWLVRPDLERIFAYRREQMEKIWPSSGAS